MPDEVGTEATRSDAPGADDSPVGDIADDKPAAPVEEKDAPRAEAAPEPQDSDEAQKLAAPSEELKVVVAIKGSRATIGVQRPSADPHIETFDDSDLPGLAQEVLAVTERARARWEDQPKHPAYARPASPARRRGRRQQGDAQAANAEGETAHQQTLRLF